MANPLRALRKTEPATPPEVKYGPIPRLEDADPNYKSLLQKIAELRAERERVEREISEIHFLIANNPRGPDSAAQEARVAALLADEDAPPPPPPPDRERLRELDQRSDDLRRAIDQLELRERSARGDVSAKIVREHVRDRYAEVVDKMCRALIEAHKAHVEYDALRTELDAKEIQWVGLGPMPLSFFGSPHEWQSPLGYYLRQAIEHGFLEASAYPQELRHK
jgi:hypothetical protein